MRELVSWVYLPSGDIGADMHAMPGCTASDFWTKKVMRLHCSVWLSAEAADRNSLHRMSTKEQPEAPTLLALAVAACNTA